MIDWEIMQRNGFFYFDICNLEEIESLKALCKDTFYKNQTKDMLLLDGKVAIEISNKIYEILGQNIHTAFPNHNYFIGRIGVKSKHTLNNFDLHRDWNIVDESIHNSIQVWIPLSISYPENGGMCFIPHSQEFENKPRSGSLGTPLIKIEPDIYPYLSYTRLHPGQAVCFYCNTLHGSFSNPTEDDRMVIIINLNPKEAELEYAHYDNENKTIQTYKIDPDVFLLTVWDLAMGHKPITELIKETPVINFKPNGNIAKEEILTWIEKDRAAQNLFSEYEYKQTYVLNDQENEKDINKYGYTIIQLLSETDIETLTKILSTTRKKNSHILNIEEHLMVFETIKHRLDLYFKNYASPEFVVNRYNEIVLNECYTSPSLMFNCHLDSYYECCCFFSDLKQLNVVPFSHRLVNQLISPAVPYPLIDKKHLLDTYSKSVSLKAGQAILYDTRLIYNFQQDIPELELSDIVFRIRHKNTKQINISSSKKPNTVNVFKLEHDPYCYKTQDRFHFSDMVNFSGELKTYPHQISEEDIKKRLKFKQYE
jgi:hypothetical protein